MRRPCHSFCNEDGDYRFSPDVAGSREELHFSVRALLTATPIFYGEVPYAVWHASTTLSEDDTNAALGQVTWTFKERYLGTSYNVPEATPSQEEIAMLSAWLQKETDPEGSSQTQRSRFFLKFGMFLSEAQRPRLMWSIQDCRHHPLALHRITALRPGTWIDFNRSL